MQIIDKNIDEGKPFDWGNVSSDYAKFRDIYPSEFYQKIIDRNLCTKGQNVLDIGTGTGVLPRNLYSFGAKWTGCDISENQIEYAKILAKQNDMDINFFTCATENLISSKLFQTNSFDVITACQCFFYFNHQAIVDDFCNLLKPNGKILVLYMTWLPFEDKIAKASEDLVLKYNPTWSGKGETVHPIFIPDCYKSKFEITHSEEFLLYVPFTQENWHGRIKACRGIGASLSKEQILLWENEHKSLLEKIAPKTFTIKHYGAIAELTKK